MDLALDLEELKNKFDNKESYTKNEIIDILCRLPLMLKNIEGIEISGDKLNISISKYTDDFEIDIPDGFLNKQNLMSVEIPKLAYDERNLLKLKLEIFPFDIGRLPNIKK